MCLLSYLLYLLLTLLHLHTVQYDRLHAYACPGSTGDTTAFRQRLHTLTALLSRSLGMGIFFGLQDGHTSLPQCRQWCLRREKEKSAPHSMQLFRASSGTQYGFWVTFDSSACLRLFTSWAFPMYNTRAQRPVLSGIETAAPHLSMGTVE